MAISNKPLIGITPLVERAANKQFMLNTYMESVYDAGGVPVMLSLTEDEESISKIADMCDGFLFSGGHDVHPSLYSEEMLDCVAPCEERDAFEIKLLHKVLKADKPVFCICRGMQLLNVALGGTLYQDIATFCPSDTEHRMSEPSDKVIHGVEFKENTPIAEILRKDEDVINSYHHQCVKKAGEGLKIMAWAPDGIVEGLYMPDKKFVLAVQWHPERLTKKYDSALKLFKAFVKACQKEDEL